MIISIISSIFIWGAIAIIALRLINTSGVPLGNGIVMSYILSDKSLKTQFSVSKKELLNIFILAFVFRIAIFLLSICAMCMFYDNIKSFDDILAQYVRWDANSYVNIAKGGYTYYTENGDFLTLVFFPLYSWLMKIVNIVFRDLRLSGLILSFALYSGACCYLYKLLAEDYSKSTAYRSIIYISVFPHALFFGTLMSESMLLFTSAATLYYIRKHKWHYVGIFGAFASISRMVGILLAIPAAVEWIEEYKIFEKLKNKDIKTVWKLFYSKGLWIFLMLVGLGVYLFCNYKTTGEWFKFLEYQQKYWNNGSCYFGNSIAQIFLKAITETKVTKYAIWIPEIISIIFVMTTLLYGIRRNRTMYSAFLALYLVLNTGFIWPISVARYMSCAIPAFIFLADFSERHKWSEVLITTVMAVGMGIYIVGYFTWKQIL